MGNTNTLKERERQEKFMGYPGNPLKSENPWGGCKVGTIEDN